VKKVAQKEAIEKRRIENAKKQDELRNARNAVSSTLTTAQIYSTNLCSSSRRNKLQPRLATISVALDPPRG
jgi:hypothetical protein